MGLHSCWPTLWMCWRVKTLWSSWWLTTTRSPPCHTAKPQTQLSRILTRDLFPLLQSPFLWPGCYLSLLSSWKRRVVSHGCTICRRVPLFSARLPMCMKRSPSLRLPQTRERRGPAPYIKLSPHFGHQPCPHIQPDLFLLNVLPISTCALDLGAPIPAMSCLPK